MTTPAARRLAPALAVVALSALTAACGGGGGSSSGTTTASSAAAGTTTTGAAGFQAAFAAYRTCLSQHGVKLPTGGFRRPPSGTTGGTPPAGGGFGGGNGAPPSGQGFLPAGVSAATFQKAQQACASKRPTGGFRRGGGFGGGQISSSALAAFRSCMQSHGVTLSAQGGFRQAFTDAKGRKAFQTCRVLLPQRPTGTSGTTTGQ
jgi:hypothetical protein